MCTLLGFESELIKKSGTNSNNGFVFRKIKLKLRNKREKKILWALHLFFLNMKLLSEEVSGLLDIQIQVQAV